MCVTNLFASHVVDLEHKRGVCLATGLVTKTRSRNIFPGHLSNLLILFCLYVSSPLEGRFESKPDQEILGPMRNIAGTGMIGIGNPDEAGIKCFVDDNRGLGGVS